VVGLLQGLLRSRLVAEELAQETFLVAYRDWARVGGLDNYYEDYSIDQIAAALGRAPGTIKAQLHHGRRKLARLLGTGPDGRST
jgi:DNA-directed RNA polymerase specialized sigma24 family protein